MFKKLIIGTNTHILYEFFISSFFSHVFKDRKPLRKTSQERKEHALNFLRP